LNGFDVSKEQGLSPVSVAVFACIDAKDDLFQSVGKFTGIAFSGAGPARREAALKVLVGAAELASLDEDTGRCYAGSRGDLKCET
jgi:hypothetical protein